MATIGNVALTYSDWAKRVDDGFRIANIIEILSQTNEILDDMMVVEGNLPTGHKTTVRTGLPQATWRLLNQGVPNAKSTTAQIVDACGNLETYSVIDKDIADLNGNTAEFRLSESRAFLAPWEPSWPSDALGRAAMARASVSCSPLGTTRLTKPTA